jgi:hypothetical protein
MPDMPMGTGFAPDGRLLVVSGEHLARQLRGGRQAAAAGGDDRIAAGHQWGVLTRSLAYVHALLAAFI